MCWRFSDLILGLFFMAIDWFLVASFLALASVVVSSVANGAEPPRYEVTNRTTPQPAFTVVNRIGTTPSLPDPNRTDYAGLLRQVEGGLPGLLTIGGTDEQAGGYWAHAWLPSGSLVDGKGEVFPDGVWYCSRINGVASMVPWDKSSKPAATPEVVVTRPFPDTTPVIIAQPAAGLSTSYPVTTGTGRTTIPVLSMGRRGGTNCTSYG